MLKAGDGPSDRLSRSDGYKGGWIWKACGKEQGAKSREQGAESGSLGETCQSFVNLPARCSIRKLGRVWEGKDEVRMVCVVACRNE